MLNVSHLVSTADLGKNEVYALARKIDQLADFPAKGGLPRSVEDKRLGFLFYGNPSRRTFDSFVMAVQDLGWQYAGGMGSESFSGMIGGESLEHAVYFYGGRCHGLVLRHDRGDAQKEAASYSAVPVLSAGGSKEGEHPTQALGDFALMRNVMGGFGGKEVAFVGNLLDSSSVRSLFFLMRHEPPKAVYVVSPDGRCIEDKYARELRNVVACASVDDLPKSVRGVYLVQSPGAKEPERFQVTKRKLDSFEKAVVFHPLPAGPELSSDVASDSRVLAKGQLDYAHFARMACLDYLLARK